MSVAIFNLRQFQRMAAVLLAAEPGASAHPLTIDALTEVFAVAAQANCAAFRATYGERADGYLARLGGDGQQLGKEALVAALAKPVAVLEPENARSDAELLLYNTVDNDGGAHLSVTERLAVERLTGLVIDASDRMIRTGQREPRRFRLIEGGAAGATPASLQDRR
jgi:hypothetical protein